jgi:hypothetical protein
MKRLLVIGAVLFSLCAICFIASRSAPLSEKIFRHVVSFKIAHKARHKVVPGTNGWLFLQPELEYVVHPLPKDNIRLIAAFSRILAGHGMTLYVAPLPNKIDVYPESLTLFAASNPVSRGRSELLEGLRQAGVRVIDVLPAMVNEKASRPVFDPYESHWTSEGIVAAAGAIAHAIDSGLTAHGVSRTTRYTVRDTVLQGCADLPERYKGDGAPFWYPTPVKQVLDTGGNFYTDDKTSDILILGDSFVDHGRSWGMHLGAQLARFIGHPTRTYCSLLANTEGPSMYNRVKSIFPENGIVIWAFASRVLQYHMCTKPGAGT